MKRCKFCKQTKSNISFDSSKRSKDGLKTKCKSCTNPPPQITEEDKFCSQRIGCDCGCMDSMADGLTIAERLVSNTSYYNY